MGVMPLQRRGSSHKLNIVLTAGYGLF
jgi:hypothetical protein